MQALPGSDPLIRKSVYPEFSAETFQRDGCEPRHRHEVVGTHHIFSVASLEPAQASGCFQCAVCCGHSVLQGNSCV